MPPPDILEKLLKLRIGCAARKRTDQCKELEGFWCGEAAADELRIGL